MTARTLDSILVRRCFLLLVVGALWAVHPLPTRAQATFACAGDCDEGASVTVDELLKGVNIALGELSLSQCPLFDTDGNKAVTVDEILAAVNNALSGCPSGELAFDKISLAVFPGAKETLNVTVAKDEFGQPIDWSVTSSNPSVASAVKNGSAIEVTGIDLGAASIIVTTASSLRRTVPVRVYDPSELKAEILIRYIDHFSCLGTFAYPVVPEGWHSFGFLGNPGSSDCSNIDGHQWTIVVKENPEYADPDRPPLALPIAWNEAYRSDVPILCPVVWSPLCDEGYVGMGQSVRFYLIGFPDPSPCSERSLAPPSLGAGVCVREDLTVPGVEADHPSFIFDNQAFFRTEAPENVDYDTTTAFLETGTVAIGGDQTVKNVLAVHLPLIIDAESSNPFPRMTSLLPPPDNSEPFLAKALLIPFTLLLNGRDNYTGKSIAWMVENSPFVRMERIQSWRRELYKNNEQGSTTISETETFKTGITLAQSETIQVTTGVSVTAESGVSFLGTGGKVSATVSFEFGYTSQHTVSEFEETDTTLTVTAPPGKAAAAWLGQSQVLVKLHHPQFDPGYNRGFEELVRVNTLDSRTTANADYPR